MKSRPFPSLRTSFSLQKKGKTRTGIAQILHHPCSPTHSKKCVQSLRNFCSRHPCLRTWLSSTALIEPHFLKQSACDNVLITYIPTAVLGYVRATNTLHTSFPESHAQRKARDESTISQAFTRQYSAKTINARALYPSPTFRPRRTRTPCSATRRVVHTFLKLLLHSFLPVSWPSQ